MTCETIKVFKITSAKIIGLSLWEAKGSGSKNKKYIHHPTEGNNQVMLKRSVGNSSDSKVEIPTPTGLSELLRLKYAYRIVHRLVFSLF